jgi:hypothetical protein
VSFAVVALTWLAVGLFAVASHPGAIEHLIARGLEPLVAARDAAVVPGDTGNEPGSFLCRDVGTTHAARLDRAMTLMRRTTEGNNLYHQLIDNDVCVTVRDLGFFAGIARPRQSLGGGWNHSTIEIDQDHLETSGTDVVATTLVHEATHIDRTIRGITCLDAGGCTVLDNDVHLEEEVAAHAAEARWWLAVYGRRGKSNPDPGAAWENQLTAAYLAGPETFTIFVQSFRSDPQEAMSR